MSRSATWNFVVGSKLEGWHTNEARVAERVLRILEVDIFDVGGEKINMRGVLDFDVCPRWSRWLGEAKLSVKNCAKMSNALFG